MDIRTKLVLTLVAVSLVSMAVLGVFAFEASREMLEAQALRHLASVAEGKGDDLARARVAWGDRARLIASRTQLRLSLRRFLARGEEADRERLVRILEDARSSLPSLTYAAVVDAEGRTIAFSGELPSQAPSSFVDAAARPSDVVSLVRLNGHRLAIALHEKMVLDGELIGFARVVLDAGELQAIARDYTGLGETGETLIVHRLETGDVEILTPPRHEDVSADMLRIPASQAERASVVALAREEGTYTDLSDYAGRRVWAATNPLGNPDWGIVAKIDAEEAERPILELRETLVRVALSLSALGVLAGLAVALFISRPIRELAAVATRIREGEKDLRADANGEDEIAELARAFNAMADELIAAREESGPGA